MNREELIAPEQYNVVSEFEKFATEEEMKALIFVSANGEEKEISYRNLMQICK